MALALEQGSEPVDCLAATLAEEHDNALRYDYPMFSVPMTSAEFIEAIG